MNRSKEILIIGGGIIGLFSAYYLSRDGHNVIIADALEEGSEQNCSSRNAGMLVPSHFIPLASPGIIAKGLRWMLNRRSPFYLQLHPDLRTLSWLYRFWRSATSGHVQRSAQPLLAFNSFSLDLFKKLDQQHPGGLGFHERGLLMICQEERTLHEENEVAEWANRLGLKTETLDHTGLQKLEPKIEIKAAGGVLYTGDAHLHPGQLIKTMKEVLVSSPNVSFIYGDPVVDLENTSGQVTGAITGSGKRITAEEFILCAGVHSYHLARRCGLSLPLMAGKGYSLTIPHSDQELRTPSIFCEARVAVTPFDQEIRFGGTMELGSENRSIDPLRIDGIIRSAEKYFPQYDTAPLRKVTPWSGMRPCPPDGLPYLGRFRTYSNLIAATGHSMMGLSLAPGTGKIVSEIVNRIQPSISIEQYSPERF